MKKKVFVKSPSNIAFIKYMGKLDVQNNLPSNASLSMTLSDVCTVGCFHVDSADDFSIDWGDFDLEDELKTLKSNIVHSKFNFIHPDLNQVESQRFFQHAINTFERLKILFPQYGMSAIPKKISVKTANTFPKSAGIASSASAFSALTLGVCVACCGDSQMFDQLYATDVQFKIEIAGLCRLGSGSSCRSLHGPFVAWTEEQVEQVDSNLPPMSDLILVLDQSPKEVSSSKAHKLVETSSLWGGRGTRANLKVKKLKQDLKDGSLSEISPMIFQEAMEMHALFSTSIPAFTYLTESSQKAIRWFSNILREGEHPIVTLDAGPNVHIIVPKDQVKDWKVRIREVFPGNEIIEDSEGSGATYFVVAD